MEHLTRTEDSAREWIVLAEDGAVNFLVWPDEKTGTQEVACTIGIHGRRKLASMPKRGRCDVLPGGYCYEQAIFQGMQELWLMSGHGKEPAVIWEVLEGWYRTTFEHTPMKEKEGR